jgi:hydroxyacylglutathione hydrolase
MLQLKSFTFNPFMENTYVLYDDSLEAVIFDPGCYEKHEQNELMGFIEEENLQVKYLMNTHCHIDHVLGNAFIKNKFQVPLYIHEKEHAVLNSVLAYAPNYGFGGYQAAQPDFYISEDDIIQFGKTVLEIRFVPGHSPGHVVFYHKDTGICIAGDTLFRGSIGRTDLPGGDHQTLLNAIKKNLFSLPEETKVYPGHGEMTTIGFEKEHNPFVGKRARY